MLRQRGLQQGQVCLAANAAKVLLKVQQRRCTTALLLITRAPVIDALRFAFNLRHHALDQVRGVERAAQRVGQIEAMQRERFVQALLQTAGGRLVERGEFLHQAVERAFRIGVAAV